jgi:tripartite-type tricarboxylate transporter receptor subunit TctC
MRTALLFLFTLLLTAASPAAEVYPSRPVRVIVAFAPGGGTDFTARLISTQLSEQTGKPFIVENRTGASGTIGYGLAAKSPPDGYTLLMMDLSMVIVPNLFKSLPFDVARDYTPITQIVGAPNVLLLSPTVTATTLREFIALAQANPGKLNYGSAGAGSAIHLTSELFNKAAKVSVTHVPYKGGGEAMTALLGSHVDVVLTTVPSSLASVNSGKLRALAVTTSGKRSPAMPDVPSMSEAGVYGMTVYSWYGFGGPAGLPKEIVARVHAETVKALAVPSLKERYLVQGSEPVGSGPEAFSKLVRDELRRWAEVVRTAGITPE